MIAKSKESFYVPEKPITRSQELYVDFLRKTFNIFSTRQNEWISYNPVSWQKEFHAYSINALHRDLWKDRLVVKGRGISFSVSSMIDLIVSATKFNNIVIPVVSHRLTPNAIDLVEIGRKLALNANIDFGIKENTAKSELVFKDSGSIIRAYPSGNVNALRQLRTFTGLLDEVTFYRDINGVMSAAQSMMSEGGQITMGSTVWSETNYFWELYQKQRENPTKYVFDLPIFDKEKFDINKSIISQYKAGLLPLVWWQDLNILEDERLRDRDSFLREHLCTPSSSGSNFIPMENILRNVDESLTNFDSYSCDNKLTCGIDIASTNDYASISIVEHSEFGLILRHQKFIKGISLPKLQTFLSNLIREWNFVRVRLDMTGIGTQIGQALRTEFGSVVEPIHFGSVVEGKIVGGSQKITQGVFGSQSVREKMAYNLLYLFSDDKIKVLNDSLLIKHVHGMSWDLKQCLCTDGHCDGFWSLALASLPLNYKSLNEKTIIKSNFVRKEVPESRTVIEW